jgi:hypothetical protein
MKKDYLMAIVFLGLTTAVCAQATPEITKTQVNQQERIEQGRESGELTKREARKLEREQARIQYDKKAAKADGVVTPQEKRKIKREQNKASRKIYRQKHDVQTSN